MNIHCRILFCFAALIMISSYKTANAQTEWRIKVPEEFLRSSPKQTEQWGGSKDSNQSLINLFGNPASFRLPKIEPPAVTSIEDLADDENENEEENVKIVAQKRVRKALAATNKRTKSALAIRYPFEALTADISPIGSPRITTPRMKIEKSIIRKLGIRYKFGGEDNRGYDCSGLIYKVFNEAGINLDRVTARELWKTLPKATGEDKSTFGTLVFFRGVKHVGIVRDANSFYHASRSKGVVLSTYNTYWKRRLTGYRRSPVKSKA